MAGRCRCRVSTSRLQVGIIDVSGGKQHHFHDLVAILSQLESSETALPSGYAHYSLFSASPACHYRPSWLINSEQLTLYRILGLGTARACC